MSSAAVDENAIAIIGVAGRFPGAGDVRELWRNLCAGMESVATFTDEELLASGVPAEMLREPNYVRARSVLDRPEYFDAAFFGFNPREAELTDPQHRIFLECAWTALEDAGLDPGRYRGAIGVYAGASLNTYLLDNIGSHRELMTDFITQFQADGYPLLVGSDKDYLATRVSYKLNLRGPSVTVQTACSTSLVAVCHAVQALLTFQCDAALAGGVSVTFPQQRGHLYQEGAIASGDGHCRPFDADAKGTVFGSGCGVVVLKRLADALDEHDHVYAIIKSVAMNNDGASKVSFLAPSIEGQAEVISLAHALARVSASSIGYVEAHGTGTPLGDPIEVSALTQAFRATTDARGFCRLGAIKSNFGHLEAAAGVTGLIKTALALEQEKIPPTLHFKTPNPRIDFASSPFAVVSELMPWERTAEPRRAGVSSFGVGGTNAHVVLEEAPLSERSSPDGAAQLLVLSARTRRALEDATTRLATFLRAHPDLPLGNIAFTLQTGRRAFEFRRFLVASNAATAAKLLLRRDRRHVFTTPAASAKIELPEGPDELTMIGGRWLAGEEIDWQALHGNSPREKVSLPTYPFQRERFWIEPDRGSHALPAKSADRRGDRIAATTTASDPFDDLKTQLAELSGLDLSAATASTTLLDLGFDSLFLTQAALALQKKFGVKLRFRQLLDELATLGALAEYLQSGSAAAKATPTSAPSLPGRFFAPAPSSAVHGPFRPLQKELPGGLSDAQRRWLDDFIARFNARTAASKAHTARHRAHFADPRAVAGFKDVWKELVYPIVAARSSGAKIWDLDGHEYIDTTMGFGLALFGHQPPFVVEAIRRQMERGMEIGPASPLAGEVAGQLCALVGMERATFCNTGSEAVLGAIRIARTVTGRNKIALFAGAYHGINDEALVRPLTVNGEWRTVPIAPGIIQEAVANVLVLEYGHPHSLEVLRTHAHELAAVLVEPVQSRRPDLQPREFLHELRALTEREGIALVFDEVITGFRCHPAGAQAHFGVRADIATYGKILGGGLPIGAIAGRAEYLDAFDGGNWVYGDDSYPTAGVTFFAGTFVRHPLALAAAKAVLDHLEMRGPQLQQALTEQTIGMIGEIAPALTGTPFEIPHFTSVFYVRASDFKFSGLLYALLRDRGIHIWEGRPCFLGTAHTAADRAKIAAAFRESIDELRTNGFFAEARQAAITAPADERIPVTEAQREIWLAAQLGPEASASFNESTTLELRGPLQLDALRRAATELFARHEALRSAFDRHGETFRIMPAGPVEMPVRDFAGRPEHEWQSLLAEEGRRAFNLEHGPLLHFEVWRVAPERHLLVTTAHHLACDGWSHDIVLRDLAALYSAFVAGAPNPLGNAMRFRDYAAWEQAERTLPAFREKEQFWRRQLHPPPPALTLPADRTPPLKRRFRGDRRELLIPQKARNEFAQFAQHHGVTLFSASYAAFVVLLHRLSGQDDFVVGIPTAGQNLVEGSSLVGHCVHLLPVRHRILAEQPFDEFVKALQERVLEAYENQNLTFGEILRHVGGGERGPQAPLVSVIFNLESAPLKEATFAGLDHQVRLNPRQHYQFDLGFNLVDTGNGLRVECDFNPDLFDADTIERWLAHYARLWRSAVSHPGERLSRQPLLSDAEQAQIVVAWNQTAREFPDRPVNALFVEQTARAPGALAIIDGSDRWTYAELDARATRVAELLSARGVQPGDFVALPANRNARFVAAILGILKAGGAYVPWSPDDPAERIAKVQAECRWVLASETVAERKPLPDTPPSENRGAAYVLYTSGSTGTPKGVVVPHRAITRLVCNTDFVQLRSDDVVAMASNLCFDAATFEIWGALLNGATLVVTPAEVLLSATALALHFEKHQITTLFLTTALFNEMVQQTPAMFAPLRNLIFGGETADPAAVRLVLAHGKPERFVHAYGPTETTTFAICHRVDAADRTRVPIGRPIANTTAYILDAELQPVPIGVTGELWIGGPGVALGYHARPDLTAERFVETRFGRLYRTGDLARWLPDGTVDHLGRVDQQIKLRGFRIEPGEIEAALRTIPGVGDAIVVARENGPGGRQLVAYFTPNGSEPAPAEMRDDLARLLPAWMIPAAFIRVSRFPLTPNGKLDLRALPAPPEISAPADSAAPARELAGPTNTLHAQLIDLWERLLGRRPIGIHDDFFALGGHSLLAARMFAELETQTGQRLPFSVLFDNPTIAHLTELLLQKERQSAAESVVVSLNVSGRKPPFFFLHGDFSGGGFYCRAMAQMIGEDRPFHILHPHGLHGELPPATIEQMASERLAAVQKLRAQGPWLLGGFCNGALVAFEMARQLEAAGETVGAVVLFSAEATNVRYRYVQQVAAGVGKIFGDSPERNAQRFRHWREKAMDLERWGRGQMMRVRTAIRHPEEVLGKAGRLLRQWRHGGPGDATAVNAQPASPTVFDAYVEALEAYVPRPVAARVALICPEEDIHGDPAAGWRAVARNLQVITVPGEHHSSIAREQNLRVVADAVRRVLDAADTHCAAATVTL